MSAPTNDNMSTDEKDILCEIEATVTTGFEPTAMEEAVEKLNAEVTVSRGRIILKVPISKVKKVIFYFFHIGNRFGTTPQMKEGTIPQTTDHFTVVEKKKRKK